MKGVLLSRAPSAKIIDLTHDIPPQNIAMGAFQLMTSYSFCPKGTLVMAIVDPGVGTERRILYGEAGEWRFLGPDNGLMSWAWNNVHPVTVVDMDLAPYKAKLESHTFHGRDIFAPIAARLLAGEDPVSMGTIVSNWVRLPWPSVEKTGTLWKGAVLAVDGFGNMITNIRMDEIRPIAENAKIWLEFGEKKNTIRGIKETYADVGRGDYVALGGSSGFLEIAVRDGNAQNKCGMEPGDPVALYFRL